MSATVVGPYEHTGAYRPDVLAQLEGTEPQWSDAPVEPVPDLTIVYPRASEFAQAVSDEIWDFAGLIDSDAGGHVGEALGLAAIYLANDVHDWRPEPSARYDSTKHYIWSSSKSALRKLLSIQTVLLGGYPALTAKRRQS